MGWINETEQVHVIKLYGFKAEYRCDYKECGLPIFLHQLMTVDKKGGYYPHMGDPTKTFKTRRAKRTYHYQCNVLKFQGKLPPEPLLVMNGNRRRLKTVSTSKNEQIARKIMNTVQSKNKGWTVPMFTYKFGWEAAKKRKRLLKNIVFDLCAVGLLTRKGKEFRLPKPKKQKEIADAKG